MDGELAITLSMLVAFFGLVSLGFHISGKSFDAKFQGATKASPSDLLKRPKSGTVKLVTVKSTAKRAKPARRRASAAK